MRKVLLIAAATVGGVVILTAALLIYAALNLNSIVKSDRQYVLGRISASVGRDVQAQDIQIGLGWGVTLEITGLQIADDPAFSQLPFLKARQMSGQIEVLALLSGQILITRLALLNPDIRILRDGAGRLNVSTLGPHGAAAKPGAQAPARQPAGKLPIRFLVQDLSVRNGAVFYQEVPARGPTIEAGHINLDLSDVNPTRPFAVKLGLAALGGAQNLAVSGTVGPLMRGGMFEVMDAPLSFSITAGPMLLDRLRKFPELKSRIPNKLSMPDPVTVHAKLKGTPRALAFDVKTDLGSARLVYLGAFHKPAGTAFQISASGFRRDTALEISQAKIKLADLQARLSDLKFGNGAWSAKVDTNRFDLAPLAKMAAALAKYALAGSSEAHVAVASAAPVPRVRGTLALAGVGFKVEGSKLPGITDLTGTVRMDGNSATLEPTNFNLGSARAGLQGQASSLQPLRAGYSFHADGFKLAELVPERPADEQVSRLAANGTVATRPDGFAVATALTSGEGMVSNVPYRNLALRADYNGRQANVTALTLNAYGGSIAAKGDAVLAAPRPFHASVNLTNVDVQQALAAQKAKAADLVKGSLSGQINATGNSANVNQLALTAALTSPQGVVSDLEFRNLALRAGVSGGRADISSLTLNAYGGSIAAKGDAAVASPHPFRASLNLTNIDLQQALTAQKAKAANVVRGWLTGQINATGKGDNFEEIKPTLQGNGRIQIINGKLIGVNVVGSALKKINGIPVINTLITPAIVARHPSLFNSPDTDLKVARLSYVMTGPRMTSRDITVNSDDYQILGSGWFDMDKNVDLSVHLLMSRQFSTDLQAEKKNVVYLENQGGEIEIPLLVTGQLPHPMVQPDVQFLVQRAATQAVQQQGAKLLNKYIGGNKGVGKYLGPLGGGNAPSGGNPPSNPIAPLENLFH